MLLSVSTSTRSHLVGTCSSYHQGIGKEIQIGRYLVREKLRGGIGRNRERWQDIGKPMEWTWQIGKTGPSSRIIAINTQLHILPCLICVSLGEYYLYMNLGCLS